MAAGHFLHAALVREIQRHLRCRRPAGPGRQKQQQHHRPQRGRPPQNQPCCGLPHLCLVCHWPALWFCAAAIPAAALPVPAYHKANGSETHRFLCVLRRQACRIPAAAAHFVDQRHRHARQVAAFLAVADDFLQALEQREEVADEIHSACGPAPQ